MRTRPAAAFAFGLCLSAAAESPAAEPAYPLCSKTPTTGEIAGAKGAFQAGRASFEEADYGRAIEYWQDAYRRDCTAHALLLNLARAYELSGRKTAALTALETYLERVPNPPDREKLETRMATLRGQIEAEASPAPVAAPPSAPAPKGEPAAPSTTPPSPAREVQSEAAAARPSRGRRPVLPLFLAGAGGAIAIVGTILYIPARTDLDAADKLCPDRRNCESNTNLAQANNALTRVNVSGGIAIGGAVLLGAGLAWYFLSPVSPGPLSRTRFTPLVAPSFAGARYETSF